MQDANLTVQNESNHPIRKLTQMLKNVRGDNTHQLIEAFTSEMTLVAEGLCEDQGKLRTELDDLLDENRKVDARYTQEINRLYEKMDEQEAQLNERFHVLEEKIKQLEKPKDGKKIRLGKWQVSGGFLHQLTVLVSIVAGAWVVVTLLNLIAKLIH